MSSDQLTRFIQISQMMTNRTDRFVFIQNTVIPHLMQFHSVYKGKEIFTASLRKKMMEMASEGMVCAFLCLLFYTNENEHKFFSAKLDKAKINPDFLELNKKIIAPDRCLYKDLYLKHKQFIDATFLNLEDVYNIKV
jgi:hypothetical protein